MALNSDGGLPSELYNINGKINEFENIFFLFPSSE